jgi:hypothetical protein
MKRTALALAAVAAAFITTVAAAPQDEWVAQVRRLLQNNAKQLEDRGFSMTHRIYTGSLNASRFEMVSLDLDIGTQYAISGACDNDCSDLDFVLYDPAGNQVDDDVQTDDYPLVATTPRRSGTYRLKVVMAACSVEPCRYGVAVFGK